MTFTVIIPTLNEAGVIDMTLVVTARLGFHDIIVVDGGSTDDTRALVESAAARTEKSVCIRLLSSEAGRAKQLNVGAAACTADVLLFLHADTHLPAAARHLMEQALVDPAVLGGRFDVRFDRPSMCGKVVSTLMNVRSRIKPHLDRRPSDFCPSRDLRTAGRLFRHPDHGRHRLHHSAQTDR